MTFDVSNPKRQKLHDYAPGDLLLCQTCQQPITETSVSYEHCQDCWELLCSQSWWEMVGEVQA